ncbi:MAG: tail fiber domain-containing protein [Vicingaceae bacterium]|nr:tail fiber domain-containing protein [Vicingaceae bacterium]
MTRFIQTLFFSAMLFLCINGYSQNVGINGTGAAPDGGAMLDIAATNKGLLVPRVNITNLATIAPIVGSTTVSMLVYNTNVGTGVGYHYWDGASWVRFTTGNPLVDNGLYFNGGANRVRLGGPLVENTTVTQGAFGMTFDLTSTGDFNVNDAGVTHFQVRDNGLSYFGDDTYWNDGSVTGITLVSIIDDVNDGRLRVYENGITSVDLDANTQFVFNEQGLDRNFRIESDLQANMFFVDAGTNEIGIRTGAPANMLHMTNGGQNVGATSMANFSNLGTSGVAIAGRNTSTTSGYNAIEGITDYSGNGFVPSGVFGLAISGTQTHRAVGVRGVANGRDGNGVIGSIQINAGNPLGWGGAFYNDLGYTGFLGVISDERTKKDIEKIDGAIAIIQQLNPVTYHFDLEKYPTMGLNQELEYGFIAQEVRQILPEITRIKYFDTNACEEIGANGQIEDKGEKFVAMDYTRIIPILTKGMQEQQLVIEEQNSKIEALEKIVLELQQKINQ